MHDIFCRESEFTDVRCAGSSRGTALPILPSPEPHPIIPPQEPAPKTPPPKPDPLRLQGRKQGPGAKAGTKDRSQIFVAFPGELRVCVRMQRPISFVVHVFGNGVRQLRMADHAVYIVLCAGKTEAPAYWFVACLGAQRYFQPQPQPQPQPASATAAATAWAPASAPAPAAATAPPAVQRFFRPQSSASPSHRHSYSRSPRHGSSPCPSLCHRHSRSQKHVPSPSRCHPFAETFAETFRIHTH